MDLKKIEIKFFNCFYLTSLKNFFPVMSDLNRQMVGIANKDR